MQNKLLTSFSHKTSDSVLVNYGNQRKLKPIRGSLYDDQGRHNGKSAVIVSTSDIASNHESKSMDIKNSSRPKESLKSFECGIVSAEKSLRNKKLKERPSLSDQLATIGANAEALTKAIRKSGGLNDTAEDFDSPIFVAASSDFHVGTLRCR